MTILRLSRMIAYCVMLLPIVIAGLASASNPEPHQRAAEQGLQSYRQTQLPADKFGFASQESLNKSTLGEGSSVPVSVPDGTQSMVTALIVPPSGTDTVVVDAIYDADDYLSSLGDAVKKADLIVVATVGAQWRYSPVAMASTLKVLRTIKGSAPASPIVFQPANAEENLKVGETYFLFLGKQTDSDPNTYHVKGWNRQGTIAKQEGRLVGDPDVLRNVVVATGSDPFDTLEQAVKTKLE